MLHATRTRRLLLAAALLPLLAVPAAHAGEYSVRLTTTAGPHWYLHGRGPFLHAPQRVYSGIGTFQAGDYKSWRAVVPGEGAQIVGGRVAIAMSTPGSTMRGRVLAGTGATPHVLYDQGVEGAVEQRIPAGPYDWIQFDLRSTGPAQTSRVAENFVNFAAADLLLRDSVPPTVAPLTLPAAGTWHDATACVPFSLRLTDQGGGLLRSQVRRAVDGIIVSELGTTQVESPRPGPIEQHLADCIQPHERAHGDTTFIATAWDVSGVARELAFSVRADHHAPTIASGPPDGTRFTTARPELAFEVRDDGAGVASVEATIDGVPVAAELSGSRLLLATGVLPLGGHVIVISARDGAGNATRTQRRISIVDVAAPTLSLESPGARGESSAYLSARATDDLSGVDRASWVLSVNGEPVASRGDASQLTSMVGPLAPGSHRIELRVADLAGNVATLVHAYQVVSAPVPSMPDVGARTGAFLVEWPRQPVGYGLPASVSVYLVRNGRPMSGQLVEVRRDGTPVGTATSDEHGIARVGFRAGTPGAWQATAIGLAMDPVEVPLRVAPRIVLRTAPGRPLAGRAIHLTGRIIPALRGRRIGVEARTGGVWYPVRRGAVTSGSGSFRATVVSAAPGRVWVRMRVRAVGRWAPAVSNERALDVRRPNRPPRR